jgi:nucleoside-diphosphate-sugar epimerase
MRVLLIGGTGFIGCHVGRRLLDSGHAVALFHRGRTANEAVAGAIQIVGDHRDLSRFVDAFRRFAPDVVVDTIAYLEHEAHAVVKAFRGLAGRLVVLSSQDVYRAYGRFLRSEPGAVEPTPYAEDAPLRTQLFPYRHAARSPADELLYYYDKILVEQAAKREPELPVTILRLPLVYGLGDPKRRLWPYLGRMHDGRETILLAAEKAGWRWTRGYVENVADAIVAAIENPHAAGRVYNVGGADLTEAEWVQSIAQAAGWRGRIVRVPQGNLPPHLAEPYDFSQDLVADATLLHEELGSIEDVPLAEALAKTVAWERAHPPDLDPHWDYGAEDAAAGTA